MHSRPAESYTWRRKSFRFNFFHFAVVYTRWNSKLKFEIFFSIESSAKISRATFSVTVVPETRTEQKRKTGDEPSAAHEPLQRPRGVETLSFPTTEDETRRKPYDFPGNQNASLSGTAPSDKLSKSAILETRPVDPDDRLLTRHRIANDKNSLSQTSTAVFNNFAPRPKAAEVNSANECGQPPENK